MFVTAGLLTSAGYSVSAQMLRIATPAAFWKTWTSPAAPAANFSEAAAHKGCALDQGRPRVAASTACPSVVIPSVTPPFAVAQSVAAVFATLPPDQKTLVPAAAPALADGARAPKMALPAGPGACGGADEAGGEVRAEGGVPGGQPVGDHRSHGAAQCGASDAAGAGGDHLASHAGGDAGRDAGDLRLVLAHPVGCVGGGGAH